MESDTLFQLERRGEDIQGWAGCEGGRFWVEECDRT